MSNDTEKLRLLSILTLLLTAQSVAPQSPICTQALAFAFGAAASEICLAEEEARRANAADRDSQEGRQRFEAAAQHYRKGAYLTSNREVKILAARSCLTGYALLPEVTRTSDGGTWRTE